MGYEQLAFVAQQRHGWGSNPRPLDRKSDALPLSHCATRASQVRIDSGPVAQYLLQ